MKRYSIGFLFSPDREWVVLIQKMRPEWQAGKLNGVGGHIEEGESPVEAMVREFREEAGVDLPADRWMPVARLEGPGYELNVFAAEGPEAFQVRTMTEEAVKVVFLPTLHHVEVIPNLRWLIPMALDTTKGFAVWQQAA